MGGRAIYSVTEHGRTDYLYGQRAAAYSLPFFFLQCVERGRDDPDAHLPVAQRMTELEQSPDGVVDFMDTAQAEAVLEAFGTQADIAMHVEINIDTDTVKYEHNPHCYHRPPGDFSIRIEDGMCCYIEAKQDVENGLWRFQESVEARLSELLTEATAPVERQEASNQEREQDGPEERKAILSVTERGETRWFVSDHAGTRCGALATLEGIKALRGTAPIHNYPAANWLGELYYNYKYGAELSDEDGLLAREISHETANNLSKPGGASMWIALDFDKEVLTLRQFPLGSRKNVSVRFAHAEECMAWAVADMYRELDVQPFLEDALEEYLENYVPRQEPGMWMNL